MTANTPRQALPYMEPTDPLKTVADQIRQLAQKLDSGVLPLRGFFSGTTGTGGVVTITHNLGAYPSWVSSQAGNSSQYCAPGPLTPKDTYVTTSTMKVYFRNLSDGSSLAAGVSVSCFWEVAP